MRNFLKMHNLHKGRIAISMIQDGNNMLETLEYPLLATCYVIHCLILVSSQESLALIPACNYIPVVHFQSHYILYCTVMALKHVKQYIIVM
jgi:hypothetical protein